MNKIEKSGLKITKLLQGAGFQALWVGGVVRDKILSRPTDNIDIATDATPDEVEKILSKARIKPMPVGKKYGSILAIVNSEKIEITTFRKEGFYKDNRHPEEVEFIKDYREDAKRRDLTINAMYYDPISKELMDPMNGQKDIQAKLIRFVGDPRKRINEDALRMLRAVRFATQLNYKMESNTFAAIKTRAKYILGISGERIRAELDKIILSPNRVMGIKLLDSTGLLRFIIPEFEALKRFSHKSKKYHLEGSQYDHTLLTLTHLPFVDLDLAYALLFHDIGKPQVAKRIYKDGEWVLSTRGHNISSARIFEQFATRVRFPKLNRTNVIWLIHNHMLMSSFIKMSELEQIRLVSHPMFRLLIEHWRCDELGNERVAGEDDHTKRYKKSDILARKMLKSYLSKTNLIKKLSEGSFIMKYSDLKPGKKLGEQIDRIKAGVVLETIKNQTDVKNFLLTT